MKVHDEMNAQKTRRFLCIFSPISRTQRLRMDFPMVYNHKNSCLGFQRLFITDPSLIHRNQTVFFLVKTNDSFLLTHTHRTQKE